MEKEKIFAMKNRHKEKPHVNFRSEKYSSQNKTLTGWIQEHDGDDRGKSQWTKGSKEIIPLDMEKIYF